MPLEAIDTALTEVLDGVAFTMGYGGARVVVIVANETLVRLDVPADPEACLAFASARLDLWRSIASAKFDNGDHENRGGRIRILPRDLMHYEAALPAAE